MDNSEEYYRGVEKKYIKKGVSLFQRKISIPIGCWMCGAEPATTNEHIFPKWLLDHYNYRDVKVSPAHLSADGVILDKREMTFNGLLCGNICRDCNNGWMSALEVAFKREFQEGWKKTINSRPDVYCSWAIKTATTLNVSQQRRVQIDENTRMGLKTGEFSGWSVYAFECTTDENILSWAQGAPLFTISKNKHKLAEERIKVAIGEVFVCSIKIDDLCLVVYWKPGDIFRIEPILDLKNLHPDHKEKTPIPRYPWLYTENSSAVVDCINNYQKRKKYLKKLRLSYVKNLSSLNTKS